VSCRICDIPEDDLIVSSGTSKVFFPENPVGPAHIVVAVREHRPLLDDLTDDEAADLMVTARRIAAAVRPLAALEKFYAAAVGDVDIHFHLHLLPRAAGAAGLGPFIFGAHGWAAGVTESANPDELRETIRTQLRGHQG
jgi:diadenosine tetraphosphate (Ap4A) HIT family hydrolase